jgi:hypothetical protein
VWKINFGMAFSRTQLHHGQVIYALIYTYLLLYAPLVLLLFALTRLANIHRFLIYAPHFGLKPFGWLRCITLRPTYSLISNGNIICVLRLPISALFFRNTASAHSKGFCVHVFPLISNFRHVLNVVCFLLGNSPAFEVYMPTFRNTLFHLHRQVGVCRIN